MTKVICILMLLFSVSINAQKNLDISFEGYINNFSSKEKVYGASMYMFQNGRMISKSLSDSKGFYYVSGSIKTKLPFELMVSKPGYITFSTKGEDSKNSAIFKPLKLCCFTLIGKVLSPRNAKKASKGP